LTIAPVVMPPIERAPIVWAYEDPRELGATVAEPNEWKLYDMLGNVWEWTADWYAEKYYEQKEGRDPHGPPASAGH
jgi:formylglycine-generating enzyme required for sulfatase activity